MEVTNVSPSPASPTEGDDLCETDVTSVAIHSVTLLICLCGLVGNGAVLFILKRRGTSIFDLALADFLFLLFTVPSTLVFLVEDVSCSPIMPLVYLNFLLALSVLSCYWALIRVMIRSYIEYMFKLSDLWCCCDLPERLLCLVFSVPYLASCILLIFSPLVTNLCLLHQQEHCQAALISMTAVFLLVSAAPLVISSTINFIKAMKGSQQQQPKGCDIVVFLIVLFILLLTLCNFLQQFGYIVVSSDVLLLINCIHSSIKPFMYFMAGGFQRPCSLRSLQISLQRVFDEQEEKTAHSNDAPKDIGV